MIKAVIFDLDGVLLDTEKYNAMAWRDVLDLYAHRPSPGQFEVMRGLSGLAMALHIRAEFGIVALPELLLRTFKDFLKGRLLAANISSMPGADPLTRGFEDMGIPMAVATNATRPFFEIKTRDYKPMFDLFDVTILGDDPRDPKPKPAPDIFLLAARDLDTPPAECLVFEDSDVGVEAAQAAGMQVVKVGKETR